MSEDDKIRLDKWLWAARFFKTRSLAAEAVQGGKVHLNGQRVKPAKEVHIGQVLTVRCGWTERTVVVKDLSARRGPAPVARQLYEETPDSVARREAEEQQRRLEHDSGPTPADRRPNKKDRRLIHRFKRSE